MLQVCEELRQYIIDVVSVHGRHFGASLGVVELTVALHYVFNTPYDQLVWDVGHQAYGHKDRWIISHQPEIQRLERVPKEAKVNMIHLGLATHQHPFLPLGMAMASHYKG